MDPERWRRLNVLFHAALERQPAERDVFLEASCGDDPELRREVDSLLASHAAAGDFIEQPAFEAAPELLHGGGAAAEMSSLVGARLGPYEVVGGLGHGGMGVVHLAVDTRLDRRVAIKALAGHLGRDARSRERLRREAKAAAALSHPGIATVFALEEFDDCLYVVYEYVEGQTLREEIADGCLEPALVVDTALAIARALQAAHGLGIVHRDLKPENVMRLAGGGIKILDFGLASFQAPAGRSGDDRRLTLPGMLLGTPSYMAPEQLKGLHVDFRADLFSFGVLVYEIATGRHPFEGDDPASTIARILEVEPVGLEDPAPAGSRGLAAVVHTLLQKDPDDRYAATTDLVRDLESIAAGGIVATVSATGSTTGPVPAPSSGRRVRPDAGDPTRRHDAFWWWRFHQLAVAAVYGASFYGLWWVKAGSAGGARELAASVVFYGAVGPVIGAGALRLHLAFAARYYPTELHPQRRGVMPWIRRAELVYAVLLAAGAVLIDQASTVAAVLLAAAAFGLIVVSRMIEPTTTRAAFPGERGE